MKNTKIKWNVATFLKNLTVLMTVILFIILTINFVEIIIKNTAVDPQYSSFNLIVKFVEHNL